MLESMTDKEFEAALEGSKARQRRIAAIVEKAFVKGVHYGSATGDDGKKPTLLKPGAEEALLIWGLVADFTPDAKYGDGVTAPHYGVTMRCELRNNQERIVSVGYGAANTMEKKWRYRRDWKSKERVVNEDPLDLENNATKYAEKRALMDAVLRLGFSAYFTQDLEEAGDGGDDLFGKAKAAPESKPEPKAQPEPKADPFRDEPKPNSPEDLGVHKEEPEVEPPADAKPSLQDRVKAVCKRISDATGDPFAKVLFDVSSFTSGKDTVGLTPQRLAGASEKWLRSTLTKAEKREKELKLAAAAPSGPPAF